MTVCCVLRAGGEFRVEHVLALRDGVERHLPGAPFVCFSDVAIEGVTAKPLLGKEPGWWSKMELFSPGAANGLTLYLDLDTVIVGDLSDIESYPRDCAILRDFYSPDSMIGSGVILWRDEALRPVWDAFRANPAGAIREHPGRMDRFIVKHLPPCDRIQDVFPGQVVSYKAHCRDGVPEGARIVAFHGKPRPWDLAEPLEVR